jgi:uncharacterized membrane protein YdjX (TVP38/TMEM64 family)
VGQGVAHALLGLVAWAQGEGLGGALLFLLAYILGTLLFVPGSILTLTAGFLYGVGGGFLVAMPGSLIGSLLAFLLGRTVLRGPTERLLRRHPRFLAVQGAVSDNAFRVVALLRLSPLVPFNLLNYGLGVTRVPLGPYLLASALGMLPGALLYLYAGSLLTGVGAVLSGQRPDTGWAGRLLFVGGLLATVAAVAVIGRAARRALEKSLPPAGRVS